MSSNKQRVLIVSDYFYPHWTGIVKSVFNIAKSLQKEFEFCVLTVRHQQNLKKQDFIEKIKIIREDYLFSLSRAKISLSLITKFIRILPQHDVVFLNSPLSLILPISIIAKISRKKILIFHQGDLILPKGVTNWFIERIFDVSTLTACLLSNKVSTYTQDYAKNSRILKYFLKKFIPIIPPIDLNEKFLSTSKPNRSLAKIKTLKRKKGILFGFAGRFVEEKGFDVLFKAIPQVIEKIPQVHFVFAGETNIQYEKTFESLKKEVQKLKKHLTFLGLLDSKQLAKFYQTIDFIIVPSRSDCFPLVQAEAVLHKNPSIVANIPGARFLVKKTGFGLIFEKEDSEDLAEKIIKAVKIKNRLMKNYPKVLAVLNNKRNTLKIKEFIKD